VWRVADWMVGIFSSKRVCARMGTWVEGAT
jgi:hypothetical protein